MVLDTAALIHHQYTPEMRPPAVMPDFLNLGCGGSCNENQQWLHHDIYQHSPGVRLCGDLDEVDGADFVGYLPASQRYEFCHPQRCYAEPVLFQEIIARDVFEHLQPKRMHHIMEFCWGALRPNGYLRIQVPQWASQNAIIDPTHYRGFHIRSFDFFDPTTSIGRKSQFYGLRPWALELARVVPHTDVNLSFVLRKLCQPIPPNSTTETKPN